MQLMHPQEAKEVLRCRNTVVCPLAFRADPVALDRGRRIGGVARRAWRSPAGVSSVRSICTTWPMPTLSHVTRAYLPLLTRQAETHTGIAWVNLVPLVTALHPCLELLSYRSRAPPILFAFHGPAGKRPWWLDRPTG